MSSAPEASKKSKERIYLVVRTDYPDEPRSVARVDPPEVFWSRAAAEKYMEADELSHIFGYLETTCADDPFFAKYFKTDGGGGLNRYAILQDYDDLREHAIEGVFVAERVKWIIHETTIHDDDEDPFQYEID